MNIFLIAIGVSEYSSKLMASLPGAANDAIRISEFFNLWGLPKENIVTLINAEATRERILRVIRVEILKHTEDIDTIFLYYAGHGENNVENPLNPENILYCYDITLQDTIGTGLRIREVIEAMQRCRARRMYLIIDACYAQIRKLPDILPDTKSIQDEKRCFLALMSTWGREAYEKAEGGVFTTQLLKAFAFFRNKKVTCSDIVTYIENELSELKLPLPKIYWIGTSNIWFLDGFKRKYDSKIIEKQYVFRTDAIIHITDKIVLNKGYIICFHGNAKSGKTMLALQMSKFFLNYLYYSVKVYYSLSQTEAELAQLILYRLMQNHEIANNLKSDNLQAVIEYISCFNIYVTIIIDHAERLKKIDLDRILLKLGSENLSCILFSRISLESEKVKIKNFKCPDFSINEFKFLLKKNNVFEFEKQIKYFYSLYKSNPQQLIQKVKRTSDKDIFNSYGNIIFYICECDGFLDLELFCKIFNINKFDILKLISLGLIKKEEGHFVPHESLYEYGDYNKASILNSSFAEKYWQQQLLVAPTNTFVCNLMLLLIKKKYWKWLNEPEHILEILSTYCLREYKWDDLENLFSVFIELHMTDIIINSSEQLAHAARSRILQYNDDVLSLLGENDRNRWEVICCEIFYWIGDFESCINTSKDLLAKISSDSNLNSFIYLNMAVAYFFLGEWVLAIDNLNKISSTIDRIRGWKKLILGTINAIRGVDFDNGIDCLNTSIKILEQCNDTIGLGIAYGNLGECYFKKGYYDFAKIYLDEGEKYAIFSHDSATHLEILRNRLLVILHTHHAFDSTAEQIEKDILNFLKEVSDKTELMQVYNTLTTAAIYKYDRKTAQEYLNLAQHLTKGNLEYELYTYINTAALFYIENDLNNAEKYLKQLDELLEKGNNYLAKRQCINTFKDIKDLYDLEELNLDIWKKIKEDV